MIEKKSIDYDDNNCNEGDDCDRFWITKKLITMMAINDAMASLSKAQGLKALYFVLECSATMTALFSFSLSFRFRFGFVFFLVFLYFCFVLRRSEILPNSSRTTKYTS